MNIDLFVVSPLGISPGKFGQGCTAYFMKTLPISDQYHVISQPYSATGPFSSRDVERLFPILDQRDSKTTPFVLWTRSSFEGKGKAVVGVNHNFNHSRTSANSHLSILPLNSQLWASSNVGKKHVTKPKERLCATELCPRVPLRSLVKLAVLEWKKGLSLGLSSFTLENRSVHGLGKCQAKFRTGNFFPESRFPFAQIGSNYRKTAAKAQNWYQSWL